MAKILIIREGDRWNDLVVPTAEAVRRLDGQLVQVSACLQDGTNIALDTARIVVTLNEDGKAEAWLDCEYVRRIAGRVPSGSGMRHHAGRWYA